LTLFNVPQILLAFHMIFQEFDEDPVLLNELGVELLDLDLH
jgi:hypothetical protein